MDSNEMWSWARVGKARGPLLSAALGLGVFTWAGPAAAAKTITVATTADTAPGTTTGSCSLRMAVERASGTVTMNSCTVVGIDGAWVVNVPASATAYSLTSSHGPLRILRTMTVQGANSDYTSTRIQGSTAGGVFVVEFGLGISLTFNLKQLRITGSQDSDVDGAALNVREATAGKTYTVNVDKVQMDNCQAWMGGAVRNAGGIMTISDSYLHDNKASWGGAIISTGSGKLTIKNSLIQSNRADQSGGTGYGGALYAASSVSIENSTIDSNVAPNSLWGGDGGGIYIGGDASGTGSLDLDYSTVSNNVGRHGGGIYLKPVGGGVRTRNSTISGNVAYYNGGGIWNQSYLEMFNTTVAKNRAYNGSGGGVFFGAGDSGSRTVACIISDNTKGLWPNIVPQDYQGRPHSSGPSDARSLFGVATGATGLFTIGTHPTNPDLIGGANLGNLANNGGPTATHAIGTNSAAYNAEINNLSPRTDDQRRIPRPQSSANDLGGFEYKP